MNSYKPEGCLIGTLNNKTGLTVTGLLNAAETGRILEARAVCCDDNNTLHVDIPGVTAIIPKEEAMIGGEIRPIAILTRVGKPVCFKVAKVITEGDRPLAILSRAAAQRDACENYIDHLRCGDIISAKITRIEQFGAFADIGCGVVALLPIDRISVSRISSPADRFCANTMIKAVVYSFDRAERKITLTMRELLGTFEQNAALFKPGCTVTGIIRSTLPYGIFIELSPNLSGLAEFRADAAVGQSAAVFIKSVIEHKMKVKLSIVDIFESSPLVCPISYFLAEGHINYWRYSPAGCPKLVDTTFPKM